jgi:hypothetical protein
MSFELTAADEKMQDYGRAGHGVPACYNRRQAGADSSSSSNRLENVGQLKRTRKIQYKTFGKLLHFGSEYSRIVARWVCYSTGFAIDRPVSDTGQFSR